VGGRTAAICKTAQNDSKNDQKSLKNKEVNLDLMKESVLCIVSARGFDSDW
jgi:hypothetical protein